MACKSPTSLRFSATVTVPWGKNWQVRSRFLACACASSPSVHPGACACYLTSSRLKAPLEAPMRMHNMGLMRKAAESAPADIKCSVGGGTASSCSKEAQELTVVDAMDEDPFVLAEATPIREAIERMLSCGASAAIVVNSSDGGLHVVGMLSETDLLWKGAGAPEAHYVIPPVYVPLLEATFSWPDKQAFDSEAKKVLARTVGDAMTRNPVTITRDAPLSKAATTMLHNKVSQLPVLDDNGFLVGSVSRHDVLAALVTKHSPFFT